MNISENITFQEATFSSTAKRLGIDNKPDDAVLANMKIVAEKCFEPLRKWYGKPIRVNSFYRCAALNRAVNGSSSSEHVKGMAIDITTGSKEENKKLFEWCKKNLTFTQLIFEYGDDSGPNWVHISYNKDNLKKQILRIK